MFNFKVKPAVGEQKIEKIKRITQANLDVHALILAGDAASAQLARTFDPTLRTRFENYSKTIQSKLNAMSKGMRDIASGLPFTANILPYPGDDSWTLSSFAVASSTRPGVIYSPTSYECQCEGFEHHGVCKHYALRSVFEIYIGLVKAEQDLIAAYAKLGLELVAAPLAPQPSVIDAALADQLLQDFLKDSGLTREEFISMTGISPEELASVTGH